MEYPYYLAYRFYEREEGDDNPSLAACFYVCILLQYPLLPLGTLLNKVSGNEYLFWLMMPFYEVIVILYIYKYLYDADHVILAEKYEAWMFNRYDKLTTFVLFILDILLAGIFTKLIYMYMP